MKKTILLVDDAPIMRMMLRDVLEANGYEIIGEAGDGGEAIELYKEFKPDLVSMDIIMPEMDGIEGLKGILEFDPDAKVVMLTAIDQRDYLMKAIRIGAVDYIVKPFEDDRILSAVSKVLEEEVWF